MTSWLKAFSVPWLVAPLIIVPLGMYVSIQVATKGDLSSPAEPPSTLIIDGDPRTAGSPNPSVKRVIFRDVNVTEKAITDLASQCPQTKLLELERAKLDAVALRAISKLQRLQYLSLIDCEPKSLALETLNAVTTLRALFTRGIESHEGYLDWVSKSGLSLITIEGDGVCDAAVLRLSKSKAVRAIRFVGGEVGPVGIKALNKNPKIAVLQFEATRLSKESIDELSRNRNLLAISLSGGGLPSQSLVSLAGIPSLEVFISEDWRATGNDVERFCLNPAVVAITFDGKAVASEEVKLIVSKYPRIGLGYAATEKYSERLLRVCGIDVK